MILVIGLASLSRGANYTGEINIDFLSGYINAWNKWSISELQLIIFNMLMFAPLGFLLPMLWEKTEKIWITVAVSLGLTTLIKAIQLLTGTDIFEFDDLFRKKGKQVESSCAICYNEAHNRLAGLHLKCRACDIKHNSRKGAVSVCQIKYWWLMMSMK